MTHKEACLLMMAGIDMKFNDYANAESKPQAAKTLAELRNTIEITLTWLEDHERLTIFPDKSLEDETCG